MVALRFRNFVPGALGHRSIVQGALGNWPKAAAAETMVDIKDAFESEPGLLEDVALLKDVIEPGEPAPTAPVNPGITSLSSSRPCVDSVIHVTRMAGDGRKEGVKHIKT